MRQHILLIDNNVFKILTLKQIELMITEYLKCIIWQAVVCFIR